MHLKDYDLIPSVVINSDDPEKRGRVQCTVPGVLDGNNISPENLPWIPCFTQAGYQNFSRPLEGQLVWVLHSLVNRQEYWYLPFAHSDKAPQGFLNDNYDNNVEVVLYRDLGENSISIKADDTNGIDMAVGGNGVNVQPTGNININGNQTKITMGDGKISLGNAETDINEPAILGNQLKDFLDDFSKGLLELSAECTGNLSQIIVPITKLSTIINKWQKNLYSENVTLN